MAIEDDFSKGSAIMDVFLGIFVCLFACMATCFCTLYFKCCCFRENKTEDNVEDKDENYVRMNEEFRVWNFWQKEARKIVIK